jgi:acylphosphatase
VSPVERRRVRIRGHVQGVWFRESTRARAEALGLAGWVRNAADGSVEAVFEGPVEAVATAVAWCREGPPAAAVTALESTVEPPEGIRGFSVRR